MKILRTTELEVTSIVSRLRAGEETTDLRISREVRDIIAAVIARGDEALYQYAAMFDGYRREDSSLEVTAEELAAAAEGAAPAEAEILELAAGRIERYHRKQLALINHEDWYYQEAPGCRLGQLVRPYRRVGVYAPGGRAAYPSSVLMAAIPARVAGVAEIFLVTPWREGRLNPLVAKAARLAGISRVFKIGGAQAIAALAYGTQTIPPVDKIVGPGNAYVTMAKKQVYGQVSIDMLAGPSEILIIASADSDPALIAADMIGQAEHDEMAAAILITDDEALALKVQGEITAQLEDLPRGEIARRSLEEQGAIIISRDLTEALALANLYGPEHLELMLQEPEKYLAQVANAGCVFLGAATPETLGDYIAGSNHILPTGGTARFSSPLGVYDFIKRTSVLRFSKENLTTLGPAAARFARMEGLEGHARSIEYRLARKTT